MNLNEYIFNKISELELLEMYPSEDDIEKWIVDWYNESFTEIGCDGPISKGRMPPSWLANWRKHVGTD